MIEDVLPIQLISLLEYVLVFLNFCYLVFSFLVMRQIHLLIKYVKTNVSNWVFILGTANLVLAFLSFVAAFALVF